MPEYVSEAILSALTSDAPVNYRKNPRPPLTVKRELGKPSTPGTVCGHNLVTMERNNVAQGGVLGLPESLLIKGN